VITQEQLIFKPLPWAPWINNASIPVKAHFRLSISKGKIGGGHERWYVGVDGSYEVGIQAFKDEGGPGDLVWLGGDNVIRDCDLRMINELAEQAAKMTYAGRIEVFDVADRSIHPDLQPRWLERFYCAEGNDLSQKLDYTRRIWKEECYRFIPAT
jgi:hypothetical protein